MSYNRDADSLDDIVKAVRFATEYAATVTEDIFSVDHAVQNVILRELMIIGKLSEEFLKISLLRIRKFRLVI